MNRVSYFILRAHTGTGVGHRQRRKNSGEVLEEMQVNGQEWYTISKEEIRLAVGVASMAIYTDLLHTLQGEPLSSWFSTDGFLISASALPNCGDFVAAKTASRFCKATAEIESFLRSGHLQLIT